MPNAERILLWQFGDLNIAAYSIQPACVFPAPPPPPETFKAPLAPIQLFNPDPPFGFFFAARSLILTLLFAVAFFFSDFIFISRYAIRFFAICRFFRKPSRGIVLNLSMDWQMPEWEVELLRSGDGNHSLTHLLSKIPLSVPWPELRNQLYLLHQLGIISLLPPAAGS